MSATETRQEVYLCNECNGTLVNGGVFRCDEQKRPILFCSQGCQKTWEDKQRKNQFLRGPRPKCSDGFIKENIKALDDAADGKPLQPIFIPPAAWALHACYCPDGVLAQIDKLAEQLDAEAAACGSTYTAIVKRDCSERIEAILK